MIEKDIVLGTSLHYRIKNLFQLAKKIEKIARYYDAKMPTYFDICRHRKIPLWLNKNQ